MKRYLFFLIMMLMLSAACASKMVDMMPYPYGTNYVTTADQYYQVFFDEEGEAFVALEISLTNVDETPITALNVEVPAENMILLNAMQQVQTQRCLEWDTQCKEYGSGQTCVQYDYNGNCVRYERPCLDWEQRCINYEPINYYNMEYKQLDVQPLALSNSYSLPLRLLSEVGQGQRTSIMLIYKAEGYAKSFLGAEDFAFETAKMPFMSSNVQVSINVQEGLYLKGGSSNVNYISGFSKMTSGIALEASDMMTFSRSIRYSGGLVKTAQYLDPHESFSVEGSYSRSWLRVNFLKVLGIGLLIVGFIALIVFGTRRLFKYAKETMKQKSEEKNGFIVPFMYGLFTVIGLTMLWTISLFVVSVMQSFGYYSISGIFSFFIIMLAILLSLALLFGAPIYAGTRYGAAAGFFTILSILGWMFIFAVIIFIGLSLLARRVYYAF